ncbi:hypothetical protein FOZ61_005678, partial [Perkinsus olseni]
GKYKKGPLKGILRSVVGYVNDINALTVDISCRNALATLQYRARMLQARLEKEVGKDRPEEEVNVLADSEPESATVVAKREKFERRMLADSAEVAASLESWQASLEEELSHRLSSIYEDVKERVMVPIEAKAAAVEKIVSGCGVSRTELECRLARTAALEQAADELTVRATSLNARMVWKKHIKSALESTQDTVGNLVELVNSIGRMSPVHKRVCEDLCVKAETIIRSMRTEGEKILLMAPQSRSRENAEHRTAEGMSHGTELDQHLKNVRSLERALAMKSEAILRPAAALERPSSAMKKSGDIPPSLKSPQGGKILFERKRSRPNVEPPVTSDSDVIGGKLSLSEGTRVSPPKAPPHVPHV